MLEILFTFFGAVLQLYSDFYSWSVNALSWCINEPIRVFNRLMEFRRDYLPEMPELRPLIWWALFYPFRLAGRIPAFLIYYATPLFWIFSKMEHPVLNCVVAFVLNVFSKVYFEAVDMLFCNRFTLWWNRRTVACSEVARYCKSVPLPLNDYLLICATDAAAMIRRGEIGSFDLVQAYIAQWQEINGVINAMVEEQFETAKTLAKEVDEYVDSLDRNSEEYNNLHLTKPLLGVPFTVPDIVSIAGLRKTYGIKAFMNNIPTTNAEVVENLRAAGAIFLVMTNVAEAFNLAETINTIYGRTNNPRDTRRSAGGACGGEGAAIAAAGSLMGIGVDSMGSMRIPCAMNGIFGLRLTPGLVSLDGLKVPGTDRLQSVGPMCRYAKDIGPMVRAMVGNDIADNKLQLEKPILSNNIKIYYMLGLRSKWTEPLDFEVRNTIKKVARFFEMKYNVPGHRIDLPIAHHAKSIYEASTIDPTARKLPQYLSNCNVALTLFDIVCYTLNCLIPRFLRLFGHSPYTFSQLINCFEDYFWPPLSGQALRFVESKRDELRDEVLSLLGNDGILVFPAWPTTAPPHSKTLFTRYNYLYTALWSTLQLLVMVCPVGVDRNNMPLSVQLIGAPHSEALLIAAAKDIENGFGGWEDTFPRV